MNQHPKYYQRNLEHRRDNSYGKRQWRIRKVRKNLLHTRIRDEQRYWHGGFRLAGFFRDYSKDGRWCFFTYNNSAIRNMCNRSVRRYKGELTRPGMFRLVHNYENEVW